MRKVNDDNQNSELVACILSFCYTDLLLPIRYQNYSYYNAKYLSCLAFISVHFWFTMQTLSIGCLHNRFAF